MTHYAKYPAVLFVGSAVAAALISAPAANAVPTCQDAGSVTRCQTNGSVSIKAVPGTRAPNVAESIPRGNNRSGIILSW
ncbi:hypothetical protein A7U43_24065 [Mycobacterium adipatum]|uniref:Uncharacterized protein n=1 Tax=Mycobacterium adipatum TaxID=1682113 RepID=A0A172URX9_9MYCO|nr:hypothetical protein [Mycobacterium adipatum]ANE81929.1 hypothetical protein A7U43_24065 [Mycobacterium adipatum]MBI5735057.1 hypothetical protein [Mycolicibacterium neoaurum]